MSNKKRSIKREKEIDNWLEKVKVKAEKHYNIEYEKNIEDQNAYLM